MGDEPWNTEAARNALILLREAHDDWLMLLPTAHDRIGDPAPERTLRTLHQHAAAVLTWVRGLNDMAVGNNGLSGYPDTAKTPVELVDAAVYACNRAIHQLVAVGQYEVGGRRYPLRYSRSYAPSGVTWVGEEALPPASADGGKIRPRRRAAYLTRWAGKPMADGLAEIRLFMDTEIGPAVGLCP
jgi:hypothetical protein